MKQIEETKNTVVWNDTIIKFHTGINTEELIREAIQKEDYNVEYHNKQYSNRKKQIERWSKKYDNKIKDFINDLSKQPRMLKGTYKEHNYIIYLSDYGYNFRAVINCLKNEVGGVEFNIFWREEPTAIHVGDYGDSHHNDAMYYKDSHTINWSHDTKILDADSVHGKFKNEWDREQGKEPSWWRTTNLITIHDIVPFVNKIIDDFIKLQGNDYKERALEFRRIHCQLSELKKLFANTPDEDYQDFNSFNTRFNEKKGRTEEITNAISKNVYDKLFTFFNDMPLSVQNTFYKDAIGLISAGIIAKTYENHENLGGLRELHEKLEKLT